jgi:hypothetical protein
MAATTTWMVTQPREETEFEFDAGSAQFKARSGHKGA